MMQPQYQVVDLGTKKGGALLVFMAKHGTYFKQQAIHSKRCLGVDYNETYRRNVVGSGFKFEQARIEDYQWKLSEFYTAFDFLEHLPDISASKQVLRQMLKHSTKGVWLRLPSFEPDETNIKQLKPHGLRFSWTTWSFHPSHFCKAHVSQVLDEPDFEGKWTVKFKANQKVRDSFKDDRIVPDAAPADAPVYDRKAHGKKPLVTFDPPLVGQWETILTRVA